MTLSFDAIATRFDDQRGLPVEALRALGAFFAGPSLDVIEPGVGTGRIALPIAMAGHRVIGLDISRPMLESCRARATALRIADRLALVAGAATALPFGDASFDAGIIASLLYLVPEWERVLDELGRVVRNGGRVLHVHERTVEGGALRRWSGTWRESIERTGFRHQPLTPTDEEVAAAMALRWGEVTTHRLASWTFGQTVADARRDYGARLRALYATVDEATWQRTVGDFLAWTEEAFHDPGIALAGLVHLEIVEATMPDSPIRPACLGS